MVSSKNKIKSEAKRIRKLRHHTVVNRMTLAAVLTVIAVSLLMLISNNANRQIVFMVKINPILLWVSGAAVVLAAGYFVFDHFIRKSEEMRILSSGFLLGATAVLFAISLYYRINHNVAHMIFGFIAAFILYAVYNVYNKNFFAGSLMTLVGIVLVYFGSDSHSSDLGRLASSLCAAAAIALGALAVIFAAVLAAKGGVLSIGSRKIRPFGNDDTSVSLIVAGAISVIGGFFGFFMTAASSYVLIAFFIAYLVAAVVNTIKMM